jgi:ABC-type multidrug transport system fused ATPase/permease subunit
MLSTFKSNLIGYFQFYHSVLKLRLFYAILLSIVVSFLDGLGLSLLIPMLSLISGDPNSSSESMGLLRFVTDAIKGAGFSITLESILSSLLFLFVLKGIFKFFELKYQAQLIQFFMKSIRHKLISGLGSMTYKGFLDLDAGRLQNSFIAEAQKMSNAVKNFLTYIQALFMLLTYVSFAMMVNYQFALLLTVSAGLTNLLYSVIYKRIKSASNEISRKGNNLNAFMIQAIHYFKYLKSTNYLTSYTQRLRTVIDQTEHLNTRIGYYSAVTMGIREPMILLIVVAVIYVQINLLGGQLASIILSLVLFYRGLNFLMVMQQNWQGFLHNSGALRSVSNISSLMAERAEKSGSQHFNSLTNDIILSDVDLSYGSTKVLSRINIVLPRNKTIALVGESGSGKTTLANIIMNLVPPDRGAVYIGNVPLESYDKQSYRSKIGYIAQEPVIFNDNIYNNVTFWAEKTAENIERFWTVAKMASIQDFVTSLPDRELTKLGDHGILISGGQKQRISIARELYKNPEILILDEATSALDSQTELIIQENIEKLHGKYTMVVIAHRLSTIRHVDKIYLMEKGKVIVSGNFEKMVEESEKFKRMVKLQGL